MSLKNVKVTVFEKIGKILILARISNNIILYEGHVNGEIK